MRAFVLVPAWLFVACGQPVDHPDMAASCDPAVMRCMATPPISMGSNGDGNEGGGGSQDEEVSTFSGELLSFDDDYFDRGAIFPGAAKVSATGERGGRVSADYTGQGFELAGVLKAPANWFLAVPETGSGLLPTLTALDTRSSGRPLSVGVANASVVDGIFLASSGTERSLQRAQIVLTLVDAKQRSVSGVSAKLTAEMTAYRAAGSWVGVSTQNVTDDSGMLFFGNVPAGSAMSTTTITLSGAVTAKIEVVIQAGAISVVTAEVSR